MDPNGNTKNGPEQSPSQAAAEPDVMQQESPRVCKICGGPNHQGCGCEAKAAKEWPGDDAPPGGTEHIEITSLQHKPGEPTPQPASDQNSSRIDRLNLVSGELDTAKNIKTIADGIEGLCARMYDTNNYLKLIAADCITIRKCLTKEDEVKDAAENQN